MAPDIKLRGDNQIKSLILKDTVVSSINVHKAYDVGPSTNPAIAPDFQQHFVFASSPPPRCVLLTFLTQWAPASNGSTQERKPGARLGIAGAQGCLV